jgi:hypothetical protein
MSLTPPLNSQNNVIGPFSYEDWYLLRQLRESIKWMRTINPDDYRLQINKESEIYTNILDEYLKEAA